MKIRVISSRVVNAGTRNRIFVKVEIDEQVASAHPFVQEPFQTDRAFLPDGNVVDW